VATIPEIISIYDLYEFIYFTIRWEVCYARERPNLSRERGSPQRWPREETGGGGAWGHYWLKWLFPIR